MLAEQALKEFVRFDDLLVRNQVSLFVLNARSAGRKRKDVVDDWVDLIVQNALAEKRFIRGSPFRDFHSRLVA